MQIFKTASDAKQSLERSVVAIGNFDGVHIGHQAIIRRLQALAEKHAAKVVVLTFDPHPAQFFRPDAAPLQLTPGAQKLAALARYGVDATVELHFDAAFAAMEPGEFVEEILYQALGARAVVVGADFRFGKKRAGTTETLAELGSQYGFECEICEPVLFDGEVVSSTRVRQAIADGQVAVADALLGRPYTMHGEIVHGDARGRTLGFPTANLGSENQALPADGVYATRFYVEGFAEAFEAVTNVGRRPTFGGGDRMVETFVLDIEDPAAFTIYGRRARVEFLEFLREDMTFTSAEALIEQMNQDVVHARAFLK